MRVQIVPLETTLQVTAQGLMFTSFEELSRFSVQAPGSYGSVFFTKVQRIVPKAIDMLRLIGDGFPSTPGTPNGADLNTGS